ncbi:MAG: hypothetical protein QNJ74_30535 [Trichodesmium sp. MO_231.B1]|nr:hypothetical protein [Trichodesmium sp. MO_231.B1]
MIFIFMGSGATSTNLKNVCKLTQLIPQQSWLLLMGGQHQSVNTGSKAVKFANGLTIDILPGNSLIFF